MADRAVLKPVGVDMPFDLGIPISKNCKICQVFLFLRPARPFFDQALGSPQALIPALTTVWVHFSRFAGRPSALEKEFWLLRAWAADAMLMRLLRQMFPIAACLVNKCGSDLRSRLISTLFGVIMMLSRGF